MDEDPGPPFTISISEREQAGVWANFAQVSHSPYEFTLDFARVDFSQTPPQGLVVARVSLSPLLVTQLIEALQANWDKFAKRALPEEVYGGDSGDATD